MVSSPLSLLQLIPLFKSPTRKALRFPSSQLMCLATKHWESITIALPTPPNKKFSKSCFPNEDHTGRVKRASEALRHAGGHCLPWGAGTQTRFKKKKKNFSLWTVQERIAIKSGRQASRPDRWWIHLTWDNFSNKFIWSKINYCQETLSKFHLKRVKKRGINCYEFFAFRAAKQRHILFKSVLFKNFQHWQLV